MWLRSRLRFQSFRAEIQFPFQSFHTSAIRANSAKVIESCPDPEYDTGCTYCMPPTLSLFEERKNPNKTRALHAKHFMLTTGNSDWPKKVELIPGSFNSEFMKYKRKLLDPEYPVLVTSTNLAPPNDEQPGTASGYLFPDGKYFTDVPIDQADSFILANLLPTEKINTEKKSMFKSTDMDHSLILICGHNARDARCGEIAPLLVNEFRATLAKHDLLYNSDDKSNSRNKYEVGVCSHIGGHVYAGNVLIMRPGTLGLWYGNVFPSHVQGIVKETLQKGNIIQEFHRGGLWGQASPL